MNRMDSHFHGNDSKDKKAEKMSRLPHLNR